MQKTNSLEIAQKKGYFVSKYGDLKHQLAETIAINKN
jgi:hypothetical protein